MVRLNCDDVGKIREFKFSGRGAAWLARLHGVQEVAGSNPVAPTDYKPCRIKDLRYRQAFWRAAFPVMPKR
jgi:hypothetical protein